MNKISKKIVSLILCLSIVSTVCICGFSSSVSAVDSSQTTNEVESFVDVISKVAETLDSFSLSKKQTLKKFDSYVNNFEYLNKTLKAFGGAFSNFSDIVKYNDASGIAEKLFYNILNVFCNQLLDVICALFPTPDSWIDYKDYKSDNFYKGTDTLITEPAENAKWSLGYANASIVPDDFQAGEYYMGGSLHLDSVTATEVLDDMKIRVTCIDDGSGRGAVVLAVIDCLGISLTDVKQIRAQVADFAKSNNISSINISATHSHSCVDLQGFGSPFIQSVIWNAFSDEYGVGETTSGRNEKFMNNLYKVAGETIKKAYNSMEKGELYYSVGDISNFVYDKQPPYVFVKEAANLRFVPDDPTKEGTYLVDMTCHPTTLPHTTTTQISSDFIYYMEEEFNKAGYNFIYFQGAVGAVTKNGEALDLPENYTRVDTMTVLGHTLADYFLNLSKNNEIKLEPVLNARHMEFLLKCGNNLLQLAVKTQLLNNQIVKTGDGLSSDDYRLITEMGYVTFGNKVMFGLMPCEMYPEISIGGAADAETSWSNSEWNSDALIDCVDDSIDYYTVCFANDTYGYVMTDNNYAFLYPDSPADTLLSAGVNTASATVTAFKELLKLK